MSNIFNHLSLEAGDDSLVILSVTELESVIRRILNEKDATDIRDYDRKEVVVVQGQVNKAEMIIEKWFEEFNTDIIGQLDFIDKTTFGYLDSIPKKCGIRIITSNIKEKDKCHRRAERCASDRPHFEIIEITKIHQRWIGSMDSYIIEIGTDLKTDALGKSTHTIRKVDPTSYSKSIAKFEQLWELSQNRLKDIYGSDLEKTLYYKK